MPTSQSPNPDLIGMECAWVPVFLKAPQVVLINFQSSFLFQRVEVIPICIPQHVIGAQQIFSGFK